MAAKEPKFHQIDLSDAKLAKEFSMGCLNFKGAHLWPLSHFVWQGSSKEVGATFFCLDLEGWEDISLLRVEVFRLPKAKDELAERVEWYHRDRKKRRIRIADGDLFDESLLHFKAFDESWEQDSFATSKGQVIRIYQTKKLAVVFRFLAGSGTLLDHPVFKRAVKNLSIDTNQWAIDPPDVVEKTQRKNRIAETSLSEEEQSEMWQIVAAVLKRLKLKSSKSPARLQKIEQEISDLRKQKKQTQDEQVDAAIELGSLVGQTFCWDFNWEWCHLTEKGEDEYCIVSPDRSLSIAPVDWIFELITNKRRAINCELTYNLVESGRLPPSRPNAFARIG